MSEAAVDFAVAAYRDDGVWQVSPLPHRVGTDLDALLVALRPWPSDTGVIGMVAIDEDFFVIARVMGSRVRVLLSDITAGDDWPLASGVLDLLDLPDPDDEDDPQPAGDLGILADLGMTAMDMAVLCDNEDLYPDEMLSDIARRVGFREAFESTIESISA